MKLKNPIKMMKLTTAALALLLGSATAQEVFTKPVGYETLAVANGFNYFGLRLHEPAIASGKAGDIEPGGWIQVPAGITDALDLNKKYLFEVNEGDAAGAVTTIEDFTGLPNFIQVSDASITADYFSGEGFTIRPAATLASVFGPQNEAGLDAGSGGPVGADQVWVPDGDGGFHKYYFDTFNIIVTTAAWTEVETGAPVKASDVDLVYTDGIIILGSGTDGNTFAVTGDVKLADTSYTFTQGFNYISSVTPVGATLATMFGEINEAGLAQGNGGPVGADQVLIPNGSGFSKYYYDAFNFQSFAPTWSDVDSGLPVDATTISLDGVSGLVILNNGPTKQVVGKAPSFYNSL